MTDEAMDSSQQSIVRWAKSTFGPVSDPLVLVQRAAIELEELQAAVRSGDSVEVGKETADVLILLYRLLYEFDLMVNETVESKMAENKRRTWRPKGDGTGSHVK